MMQARIFTTKYHPLARMHGDFGVCFLGSKAELQAAGFGVGAVFPGEPGGNKKKARLLASNGFAGVEVELYDRCQWLGEPAQTAIQNYSVSARYLAENLKQVRTFESTQWHGVRLHLDSWCDVYSGTSDALVAAGLASISEFPGQPNCGKVRTTFSREGKRVVSGSNTASKEGNRTIAAAGKLFEVSIQVSHAEREIRHERYKAESELQQAYANQKIAEFYAQHQSRRPKGHLRLVWSA